MNCALAKEALVWCSKRRTRWMTVDMPSKGSTYPIGELKPFNVIRHFLSFHSGELELNLLEVQLNTSVECSLQVLLCESKNAI